jgi:hypothetical protein
MNLWMLLDLLAIILEGIQCAQIWVELVIPILYAIQKCLSLTTMFMSSTLTLLSIQMHLLKWILQTPLPNINLFGCTLDNPSPNILPL